MYKRQIRGWAVADEPVKIQIFDENKQKLNVEILRTQRVDVEQLYEEMDSEDKSGFFVELTNLTGKLLYLVFYAGDTKSVHIVHLNPAVVFRKKIEKYAKKGLRDVYKRQILFQRYVCPSGICSCH